MINAEHWLYWGEVDLQERLTGNDNNFAERRITHLRVLEQTIFLDDERFEPLGTTFRRGKLQEDYLRKAMSTKLESPGKIAYQNRVSGKNFDFTVKNFSGSTGPRVRLSTPRIAGWRPNRY